MQKHIEANSKEILKETASVKEKKLEDAYQLIKDGFPARIAAQVVGLTESELTKPEVRR